MRKIFSVEQAEMAGLKPCEKMKAFFDLGGYLLFFEKGDPQSVFQNVQLYQTEWTAAEESIKEYGRVIVARLPGDFLKDVISAPDSPFFSLLRERQYRRGGGGGHGHESIQ